jgi:aquaporin NIP
MQKKLLAEFLGTFLLVLFGTGAIVINVQTGALHGYGIAAAFGLSVFGIILLFGKTSGAHINPAVSIVMFVRKKLSLNETVLYLLAQFTGALAASFLLRLFFPHDEFLGASLPARNAMSAAIIEFLLTFILVLGILLAVDGGASLHTVAIVAGSIVALEAFFAGPFTGASMNPARSFGPAIVSGHTEDLWAYFAGPILGGLAALGLNSLIQKGKVNLPA